MKDTIKQFEGMSAKEILRHFDINNIDELIKATDFSRATLYTWCNTNRAKFLKICELVSNTKKLKQGKVVTFEKVDYKLIKI